MGISSEEKTHRMGGLLECASILKEWLCSESEPPAPRASPAAKMELRNSGGPTNRFRRMIANCTARIKPCQTSPPKMPCAATEQKPPEL